MQKLKNEDLNRLSEEGYKNAQKTPIVIVLDNIRSLHNVGSAFRTADAFLIEKIYLCGVTGCPPNKEIEKTALGATKTVEWNSTKSTIDAIKELKKHGYKIISVEQADKSTKLHQFKIKSEEKIALVFGNEVYGVEQEVVDESDVVLEIPQLGSKHSFNVSVSIGIVLWQLVTERIANEN
ncbi:MAG: RNA methyltransferase [Bacteroidota bacterium]|nr:RNA methyltransferase [Bacteroidota bacterium]